MIEPIILIALVCALVVVASLWIRRNRNRTDEPDHWSMGPVLDGRNYSKGHLKLTSAGFRFDFGEPHYVTRKADRVIGGSSLVVRYRFTGQVHPVGYPERPPRIALYFQRKGDNWSAEGKFELYRWYSLSRAVLGENGENTLTVPLAPESWGAVMSTKGKDNPEAFYEALMNMDRIGIVFGGGDGAGHGIVGRGSFELLDWQVV